MNPHSMNPHFNYTFENVEHIPDDVLTHVERGLDMKAYVCQQEFEEELDLFHEINVIDDQSQSTTGEAFVSSIDIDDDEINVTLNFSNIRRF
jgi:hypothetical protein